MKSIEKNIKSNNELFNVLVPYEFAFGRYSVTNYQYRLVLQLFIKAKEAEEGTFFPIITALSKVTKVVEMECDVRDILIDEDRHYTKVYSEIKEMSKIMFETDTKVDGLEYHLSQPFITSFEHCKTKGKFKVWWPKEIWDVVVQKVKGWRIVDLRVLFNFKSFYSIRFYQYLVEQKLSRRFEIIELRKMLRLEGKYEGVSMFLRKVVDNAKKELDTKSPWTFDYVVETSTDNTPGKPKITAIKCTPKYQPEYDINGEIFSETFFNGKTKQNIKTFEDFVKISDICGQQLEDLFKKSDFNYNIKEDWKGQNVDFLCQLFAHWVWLKENTGDNIKYSLRAIRPQFEGWMLNARKKTTSISERKAYVVACLKNKIKELDDFKNEISKNKNGEIF